MAVGGDVRYLPPLETIGHSPAARTMDVVLRDHRNKTLLGTLVLEKVRDVKQRHITTTAIPQPYDETGASLYAIAVIFVYGFSIVLMIASHTYMKRKSNKRDGEDEKQVVKYLQQVPHLQELSKRDSFRKLKNSIIPLVGIGLGVDISNAMASPPVSPTGRKTVRFYNLEDSSVSRKPLLSDSSTGSCGTLDSQGDPLNESTGSLASFGLKRDLCGQLSSDSEYSQYSTRSSTGQMSTISEETSIGNSRTSPQSLRSFPSYGDSSSETPCDYRSSPMSDDQLWAGHSFPRVRGYSENPYDDFNLISVPERAPVHTATSVRDAIVGPASLGRQREISSYRDLVPHHTPVVSQSVPEIGLRANDYEQTKDQPIQITCV